MRKGGSVVKPAKKSILKPSSVRNNGAKKPGKRTKEEKDFLRDVLSFRWLKKAMVGKTQEEALDLLDQWILKKKSLSLFF